MAKKVINTSDYNGDAVGKINDNFTELYTQGGVGGVYAPKFVNNPFPVYKDTIKILSLGNSFTHYPTKYLGRVLSNAGVDNSKFVYWLDHSQGRSLAQLLTAIENNTQVSQIDSIQGKRCGTATISGGTGYVRDLLSNDWDVVTIQAKSTEAKTWSTYEPYLTQIVNAIRRYCTNQKVCIAWQQTWSCTAESINASDSEWEDINANLKNVMSINGIDVVIPTGTAMQNARHTTLNTAHYLMADTSGHPLAGVARYIGACTWYQALFAPLLGLPNIVGNAATITISTDDSENSSTYSSEAADVTNTNKELCQLAAMSACTDMFNLTTIE